MKLSAVLPSTATLGCIIARGFRDGHVETLVAGPDGATISSTPATETNVETSEVAGSFNAQIMSFVKAQGQGSVIDKVTTTLDKGQIESAIEENVFVPFDQLSDLEKSLLANARNGPEKVKNFELVTALYRGNLSIVVTHNNNVSGEVKATALSSLSVGVGGKVANTTDDTVNVTGGVWLITAIPYGTPL